jgi:hypothetical protein
MRHIVLLEAGRLADQLRPLLDETQWQAFQQQLSTVKQVEQTIRNSGQWPVSPLTDDDF